MAVDASNVLQNKNTYRNVLPPHTHWMEKCIEIVEVVLCPVIISNSFTFGQTSLNWSFALFLNKFLNLHSFEHLIVIHISSENRIQSYLQKCYNIYIYIYMNNRTPIYT